LADTEGVKPDPIALPCPPAGHLALARRPAPGQGRRLRPSPLAALALAAVVAWMPSLAGAEAADGLDAKRAAAPARAAELRPQAAPPELPPAATAAAPAAAAAPSAPPARPEPTEAAAPAAPSAPAGAALGIATADPLEHLRQRLADRLAAKPLAPEAGAYDLRVSARAAPAAPAARAQSRAAPGPQLPPWAYGSEAGGLAPEAWGGLCGSGQRQSPIDLHGGLPVPLAPIRFDYGSTAFSVLDTGRAVQVDLQAEGPGAAAIEVGGQRYTLQHFSVHRPSEVQIDGRRFALSLQLTHRSAEGALAVLVLVIDPGPALPALDAVLAHLPLDKLQRNRARVPLDLATLLPADPRYFMYAGSLTTPPCTEGVLRLVMRHPLTASPAQIEVLSRLYPANVRPLQAADGRRILQSD
jgi:carbonic anhydrase